MGNAVFPVLPGLSWSVGKAPSWSTRIQKAVSGRELRAAYYSLPIWTFTLAYEVLRANALQELQQLVGFFNARQGSFDSFLYSDPSDNVASQAAFGVGDGVRTKFQLTRPYGGFVEPVAALQAAPAIFINGAQQQAGFTADMNSGTVTFTAAPAGGAALSWSGSFYYRCRFVRDSIEFDNFMKDLWQAKKVELITVK
jgi:uncharacterized protein (TIGR02217 family)